VVFIVTHMYKKDTKSKTYRNPVLHVALDLTLNSW